MATAPLGSTARTNELLSASSKQTGIAAPTFSIDTPSQVATAVSKSIGGAVNSSGQLVGANGQMLGKANPADVPGYVPGSLPNDRLSAPTAPQSPQLAQNQTPTQQPTSATPQQGAASAPSSDLASTDQVPQSLVDQVNSAQSMADRIKQSHLQALNALKGSGVTAPSGAGSASAGIQSALNAQPKAPQKEETPAAVSSYFDPSSQTMQQQMQAMMDIVSPPAQRQSLLDAMAQLKTDKTELTGLKAELMNVKNIMAGTQQDIMDEVTKAGGTITQSLLSNMTIARNKSLVEQSNRLQEQIATQQDTVNTDTSLVSDEKQLASQEYTQRMGVLNFMQTNYNNMMNASRDMYKTLISDNPEGLYNSLISNPAQAQRFESITGMGVDSLRGIVSTHQLDIQIKQADLATKLQSLSAGTLGGATLADYADTTSGGKQYVNSADITDKKEKSAVEKAARANGVPLVSSKEDAEQLTNIEVARQNAAKIEQVVSSFAPSSALTRVFVGPKNLIAGKTQTNEDIASYNAYRSAAIEAMRAMAGAKGLRINQAEIKLAQENDIPKVTDTLPVAKAKLDTLRAQLQSWEDVILKNNGGEQGSKGNGPSETNPLGI